MLKQRHVNFNLAVCVDGTRGEGEADDPESLEQTHLQVNTSH